MKSLTFATKVLQAGVQEIVDDTYKPIATIYQSDLKFAIPSDSNFYINPDIQIFVSGQLVSTDGKGLDSTDHTSDKQFPAFVV
jgi:hypothetical protein